MWQWNFARNIASLTRIFHLAKRIAYLAIATISCHRVYIATRKATLTIALSFFAKHTLMLQKRCFEEEKKTEEWNVTFRYIALVVTMVTHTHTYTVARFSHVEIISLAAAVPSILARWKSVSCSIPLCPTHTYTTGAEGEEIYSEWGRRVPHRFRCDVFITDFADLNDPDYVCFTATFAEPRRVGTHPRADVALYFEG